MKLAWQVKQFAELSVDELYLIWQLREQVFVVEQQAIYLDADGADLSAAHLLVKNGSELSAYLRILPPDANGVRGYSSKRPWRSRHPPCPARR